MRERACAKMHWRKYHSGPNFILLLLNLDFDLLRLGGVARLVERLRDVLQVRLQRFARREAHLVQEALLLALSSLAKRIFIKERLCISCVGSTEITGKIADIFPSGNVGKRQQYQPRAKAPEGICLPLDIAHAAFGFHSEKIPALMGAIKVAKSILSYEYLWPEIRVKGGSYGAGFVARRHGVALFYSYRDPNPERSVEIFYGAADFLEKFAKEKHDLTKYIIGAVGEYDILLTPRAAASLATANYLSGRDWNADDRLYQDIIKTDSSALTEVANLLKNSMNGSTFAIVANKDALGKISKIKNNIITP